MFKKFGLGRLTALLGLLSLSAMNSSLMAWNGFNSPSWDCCDSPSWDCCEPSCNRFYIGAFGGELWSDSTTVIQQGTALFREDVGGPLIVNAEGKTKSTSSGFGGVQIGYEWSQYPISCGYSDWTIAPAAEVEAFFYSHRKKGHLMNPSARLPEHDFVDSFKMDMSVVLVNGVFSLNSRCLYGFSPYVGGGIGAIHISLHDADSFQVEPVEAGINHFNSRRNDSTWAFAAQAKAGLRYTFCQCFHIFAEYRYLFVDSSKYVLGATDYPTHAPTTPFNVKIKDIQYNGFAIGLQYDI